MLEVRGLTLAAGDVTIVRRASFSLGASETLALVGESGSGKTMLALAIMGVLPSSVRVVEGQIFLAGTDLLGLPRRARSAHWGDLAMIFQEPRAALNPLMTVESQMRRALRRRGRGADAAEVTNELLGRVGLRDVERVAKSYPHQLSGGMCQRVLIAMMVGCRPALLIADEPTTALDVTVQAQIFALLDDLREEVGFTMLLITHDLGVAAQTCDRMIVLYGGQVMETGTTEAVFHEAVHPYSRYLIRSLREEVGEPFSEGAELALAGCRFSHRCPEVIERCREVVPAPVALPGGSIVYCHRREEARAAPDQESPEVV